MVLLISKELLIELAAGPYMPELCNELLKLASVREQRDSLLLTAALGQLILAGHLVGSHQQLPSVNALRKQAVLVSCC